MFFCKKLSAQLFEITIYAVDLVCISNLKLKKMTHKKTGSPRFSEQV